MKFETKESSPCVIAISVKAEAEEVQGEYKKVLNVFYREAEIPGFRKGKAPSALVKQKFQKAINEECEQACFREFGPKAIKESGLDVLVTQGIKDVAFAPESGFACTILVEVKPTFELPKYKKLSIKAGDATVTDEQVSERMEGFRKAFAKFVDAKEGEAIADGDFVQFDYSGALDVKAKTPLSEVIPDQKVVCENTGYWTQVEEGRFVPEILDALKGMKIGETKDDVKVKFPKENAPEAIKGKKCVYTVTVKAFRRRELPDDATFAENAKVASLDELRAQIRGQMEKDAVAAELDGRKNQAIEALLKKAEFAVPPSQIQHQMQNYFYDLAQRAQTMGMPGDYVEKNYDAIMADAKTKAEQQMRLSYILLGIAKEEKLEVTDADVNEALAKMAAESNGKATVEDLMAQLEENDQVELYKEQLRAEKALDFVLAEAK